MAASPAELRRSPFLRITAQRGGAASFLELDPRLARLPTQTVRACRCATTGRESPRHLPYIFDAGFSTRPETTMTTERATAWDSSIVRQLVTAAGGAVRAVSPPGLGARFDIELPILQAGGAERTRLEVAALPERIKA